MKAPTMGSSLSFPSLDEKSKRPPFAPGTVGGRHDIAAVGAGRGGRAACLPKEPPVATRVDIQNFGNDNQPHSKSSFLA